MNDYVVLSDIYAKSAYSNSKCYSIGFDKILDINIEKTDENNRQISIPLFPQNTLYNFMICVKNINIIEKITVIKQEKVIYILNKYELMSIKPFLKHTYTIPNLTIFSDIYEKNSNNDDIIINIFLSNFGDIYKESVEKVKNMCVISNLNDNVSQSVKNYTNAYFNMRLYCQTQSGVDKKTYKEIINFAPSYSDNKLINIPKYTKKYVIDRTLAMYEDIKRIKFYFFDNNGLLKIVTNLNIVYENRNIASLDGTQLDLTTQLYAHCNFKENVYVIPLLHSNNLSLEWEKDYHFELDFLPCSENIMLYFSLETST